MYSNFIINFKRQFLFQRYEGRIGARKGIFPATYVDVTVEPGETRSTGGNLSILCLSLIIDINNIDELCSLNYMLSQHFIYAL